MLIQILPSYIIQLCIQQELVNGAQRCLQAYTRTACLLSCTYYLHDVYLHLHTSLFIDTDYTERGQTVGELLSLCFGLLQFLMTLISHCHLNVVLFNIILFYLCNQLRIYQNDSSVSSVSQLFTVMTQGHAWHELAECDIDHYTYTTYVLLDFL